VPKYGGWLGVSKRVSTPEPEDRVPPSTALAPSTTPPGPAEPPAPSDADNMSMNPDTAILMSRRREAMQRTKEAYEDAEIEKKITGHAKRKSKMRDDCQKIIALRLAGLNDEQIGKKLGLATRAIRQYVYVGAKKGWIGLDDPEEDLNYRLVHKVVRNVEATLDGTLVPNAAMQEMTIAAAKGLQLFKTAEAKTAAVVPAMAIQVNIIGAPGTSQAIPGQEARVEAFGGTPAYLEGDVE
jgi:hypothetical protein